MNQYALSYKHIGLKGDVHVSWEQRFMQIYRFNQFNEGKKSTEVKFTLQSYTWL